MQPRYGLTERALADYLKSVRGFHDVVRLLLADVHGVESYQYILA